MNGAKTVKTYADSVTFRFRNAQYEGSKLTIGNSLAKFGRKFVHFPGESRRQRQTVARSVETAVSAKMRGL